jgi:hypothetical protein
MCRSVSPGHLRGQIETSCGQILKIDGHPKGLMLT